MYHLIFPITYCSICLYKGHEQIVHQRVKKFTPIFVILIKYNTLSLLDIGISTLGYRNLHKYIRNNYDIGNNLINNYISCFHALGTIFNCMVYSTYKNSKLYCN